MLEKLRQNLRARINEMGTNPTATANEAGVGIDFIRDILSGKANSPGVEKLAKVAAVLKTSIDELLELDSQRHADEVRQIASPIQDLPVIGRVSASHWWYVEDGDIPPEDWGSVPSASGYPLDWQFGMIVEGNCLNRIADHGDRLVCVDAIKSRYVMKDGDLVIVERRRFDGQMVQRTAKRIRRIDGGYELWPESTDPVHQEPIRLTDREAGEEYRVFAKVLWVLKAP